MRGFLFFVLIISLKTYGNEYAAEDFYSGFADTLVLNDTTLMVIDTLESTDTLVVYLEPPKTFDLKFYVSILPFISDDRFIINDIQYSGLSEQINTEISEIYSLNLGTGASVYFRDYFFTTGLDLHFRNEIIQHKPGNFLLDAFSYQQLDTISLWGQVVEGDTTWIAETEWNTYTSFDTIRLKNNYMNCYRYLQVPLFIGRRFIWKYSELQVSAGIINQFSVGTRNILFLSQEKNLFKTETGDIRKFNIAFCASVSYIYKLSGKFFVTGDLRYMNSKHPVRIPDTSFALRTRNISFGAGLIYLW